VREVGTGSACDCVLVGWLTGRSLAGAPNQICPVNINLKLKHLLIFEIPGAQEMQGVSIPASVTVGRTQDGSSRNVCQQCGVRSLDWSRGLARWQYQPENKPAMYTHYMYTLSMFRIP